MLKCISNWWRKQHQRTHPSSLVVGFGQHVGNWAWLGASWPVTRAAPAIWFAVFQVVGMGSAYGLSEKCHPLRSTGRGSIWYPKRRPFEIKHIQKFKSDDIYWQCNCKLHIAILYMLSAVMLHVGTHDLLLSICAASICDPHRTSLSMWTTLPMHPSGFRKQLGKAPARGRKDLP